ncbi:hypothetical protein CHS0354_040300 [Potamilus streckersoni]|uniref:Uncharacterized protein n=1 Tax=Potamilus streckersoni TaxID=2493646 RepID=A0AAE0SG90_9BIVA|nr:hypothetical protein CHS0354_040300 [Potamilus streckersoni]
MLNTDMDLGDSYMQTLTTGLDNMLRTGQHADVTIVVSGKTSVGVQATETRCPELLLEKALEVANQLKELQEESFQLTQEYRKRDSSIDQSCASLDSLESKVTEVSEAIQNLENLFLSRQQSIEEKDSEYEELMKQKGEAEQEQRAILSREGFDENKYRIEHVTLNDKKNELHLRDFVRDELFKRLENLTILQQRLDDTKDECAREWAEFKNDVVRYRQEKRTLEQQLDHFNELTVARFLGMQSHRKPDPSEQEIINRTIQYLQLEREHRELQEQYINSQIQSRDLEDEIGSLTNQKRAIWKRILDLEISIERMKGDADDGFMLRPVPAYADLPYLDEGLTLRAPKNALSDHDLVPSALDYHSCGKMLHRCAKQTNVSMPELFDKEELTEKTKADTGPSQVPSPALEIEPDARTADMVTGVDREADSSVSSPPVADNVEEEEMFSGFQVTDDLLKKVEAAMGFRATANTTKPASIPAPVTESGSQPSPSQPRAQQQGPVENQSALPAAESYVAKLRRRALGGISMSSENIQARQKYATDTGRKRRQ